MPLKNWLRRNLRRAVGRLKVLEGSEYAAYLLPVDYPPSRDLRPRWGHGRPPHAGLVELLERWRPGYRQLFTELRALAPHFRRIPIHFEPRTAPTPGWVGGPINALDLALLYAFIVRSRPKKYVEIGSGLTTCFARRAIADHGLSTRVISIDPAPRSEVDAICDRVVRAGLETADLALFDELEAGDIVFMDGSHRSFMNSDVTVFMLDVLPRLRPGVIVHVHDVVLPVDYPDSFRAWYWNEQYILAVYLLAARDRIEVLMPSYFASQDPALRALLEPPPVDLGANAEAFRNGGSMWFTHA